ncbi:Type IV secretory pathway, VirD4 component, TraG/TraD family ATPase [Hymenobacter daecheongensis DSM 21074]|uniref:Type IV secretory pathway, VirD4 component, TraG/TraD family ATPase n=1 Tax=Hymenobacter daecheongensis DSM 21074 TaxID=1121955 RepID=A0A1M6MNX1_9BACT|nr:type IV secretion system DNA-binding domain-containing protein [Hymenobacter daecheongensis]SHJ85142.1 Type IV secretory pathway, VirD4 component, TraG/TraD family ATPase [Hymenobacter daecheongensis DSM 21074]
MTTIFYWLGQLVGALVYAAIAQLAARLLHRTLPQVSRGLYRVVGLREAPDDWLVSFVRFAGLFLLATVAGSFLGVSGLATWLVLAWLGFNVYRSVSGPQEAATAAGEAQALTFTLRTTSGPNVRLGNPFRGTFIAGGAGSGKSKSIIEPILQQAGALGLTGVVYDFKFPTLAEEVAGSYAGSTVTPYFVNFTDLSRSHRVNPLATELLATASFAREAAATIITNLDAKAAQQRNFWIQSGEVLLAGCIWYLRRNYPAQCSLPAAVSMILESDAEQLLATLQQDEEVRGLIASIASASKSENTIAGVFSTIQNYLAVLNTPEIFWVMSGDQVPLDLNLAATPGVLVVGNDPALSTTFSPLISLIVATAIKRLNQQGRLPSLVLLDEAPTLFIPNFAQIPATARSNKVATVYAVQDVAQMEALTSRQESEMILANLGNQFWGRTTNTATAERVSKMFGKIDKQYRSKTEGSSATNEWNLLKPTTRTSNTSESVSIQQRDKLEAQQVMRFGVGEFAGLVVESPRPEFRATFRAEPSKAVKIAPFQDASPAEVAQNFGAIKAQVRAIVGGEHAAQEPKYFAIAKTDTPPEQPDDFAIAKPTTTEQAPISTTTEEETDPSKW